MSDESTRVAQSSEADFEDTPWLDPSATPLLEIRGLTKKFGNVAAVDNVDLEIFPRELFAILGGSGSGKTTLLRMLGGFEQPVDDIALSIVAQNGITAIDDRLARLAKCTDRLGQEQGVLWCAEITA